MALERGDSGEAVRELQRLLNRVGALLVVDGDFGPGTETAVAEARDFLRLPPGEAVDDTLLQALSRLKDPSPELTAAGVTFIAREEVSSPAMYRKRYRRPVWPTERSGITIGIGYDLQFVTADQLQADWSDVLGADVCETLRPCLGRRGSRALMDAIAAVDVPLPAAVFVFLRRMLPTHIGVTRRSYPMLDDLAAARRTALVSLVFNRGGSLNGETRREMRRIRDLLVAGETEPVADELESMTRLWDPVRERGVIERRRREAMLWRGGFESLRLV
jgi:hypothetical protein